KPPPRPSTGYSPNLTMLRRPAETADPSGHVLGTGVCGSNGVSGPITPGVMAWRERCRDDRDTRRCGKQEEGQAGADRGTEAGGGAGGPGPGAGRVADRPGRAAQAADQDGAGDRAEPGDDRAPRS